MLLMSLCFFSCDCFIVFDPLLRSLFMFLPFVTATGFLIGLAEISGLSGERLERALGDIRPYIQFAFGPPHRLKLGCL